MGTQVTCDVSSWALQIEETRQNIDKISENVEEAKKLYSVILSAPIPEQSERGCVSHPVPIRAVRPLLGCHVMASPSQSPVPCRDQR